MPTLERKDIEFVTKPGQDPVAFYSGLVDETKLDRYQGELDSFSIRVRLEDGKHVYYKAKLTDAAKFDQYEVPRLEKVFGYNGGYDGLLAADAGRHFMDKPCGVCLKPNPNNHDKYYTSIYKPKNVATPATQDEIERLKAKAYRRPEVEAQHASTAASDDLPF